MHNLFTTHWHNVDRLMSLSIENISAEMIPRWKKIQTTEP